MQGKKLMWQFLAGLTLALVISAIVCFINLRKKKSTTAKIHNAHGDQLQQLGRLTGSLAHELKNPLSTIKVNLKLIAEDLKDADFTSNTKPDADHAERLFARATRKIAVVQSETDRLQIILDRFLQYINRTDLQPAPEDINTIVGDMIDFYTPQLTGKAITIRHRLYKTPLICKVDTNMLKQAILNLFINAQQAMPQGGELIITTDKKNENAIIQINDTGTGIQSEKIEKIFEAYYSSAPKGSGLGLPTAKRIIDQHNGTIKVNSELKKGTSFTITLPIIQGR